MKAFITYNDLIQNYVIILLLHALRKYFAKATLYKIEFVRHLMKILIQKRTNY